MRKFIVALSTYCRRAAALVLPVVLLLSAAGAYAEEKQWSGKYDGVTWENDFNWSPPSAPSASDDARVDTDGADAAVRESFNLKSLTVGGHTAAMVTVWNLADGTLRPENSAVPALYIRKGGSVVLRGTRVITLAGSLKSSEETLPAEPGFTFEAK